METAVETASSDLLNHSKQCYDAGCEVHSGQVEAFLHGTMRLAILEADTRSPSLSTADLDCLAFKSYDELCEILSTVEVLRPSSALLVGMNCSAAMLRDLAETTLSCFPLPIICNNPVCKNLTKLSEWRLVCGSSCVCAGCGLARYCSKSCQVRHWEFHKSVCRRSGHRH